MSVISVRRLLGTFIITAAMAGASEASASGHDPRRGNAVTAWNTVAEEALLRVPVDPLNQSRIYAMVQTAVHDALNAIRSKYEPYTRGLPLDPHASPEAAVAAASRDVLVALIAGQQSFIDGEYAAALSGIRDGYGKNAGIALGQAAAAAIIARRTNDGIDQVGEPPYQTNGKPGDYQFTPPFDFAGFPSWGRLTPFGIDLAKHRLRGPDALRSAAYTADFKFLKRIGALDSPIRTREQSEIAQFWYEDSPIGWNRVANIVIRQKNLDPWRAARILALVNIAMADGFIAGFEAEYAFRFWRPITAIQQAAGDGNAATVADPSWQPFLVTPPVPDYPSTHTVLGASAAAVLAEVLGDEVRYEMTSTTLPGVTRRFKGFTPAAVENGMSRVFAGIHFVRAVADGYHQGAGVGRAVAKLLPRVK